MSLDGTANTYAYIHIETCSKLDISLVPCSLNFKVTLWEVKVISLAVACVKFWIFIVCYTAVKVPDCSDQLPQ